MNNTYFLSLSVLWFSVIWFYRKDYCVVIVYSPGIYYVISCLYFITTRYLIWLYAFNARWIRRLSLISILVDNSIFYLMSVCRILKNVWNRTSLFLYPFTSYIFFIYIVAYEPGVMSILMYISYLSCRLKQLLNKH